MKFVIKHISRSARLGILTEFERISEAGFETPLLLHYTKGANLPHLTREVFQMLTDERQGLSISLTNTVTFLSSLEEYNKGIAEFAAMGDCLSYICFQDTGIQSPVGHTDKNGVPLWSRHGKILMNPQKYIDIISKFKPDIYHTLCDTDTGPESSEKHLTRAVLKSNEMFNKCMELHVNNEWLANNSFLLGAVAGGYSIDHRDKVIKNITNSTHFPKLGGILIEGLQANGPFNENIDEKLFKIVDHINSSVPESLIRFISGCYSPVAILDLISLGTDAIDSSYANNVTERNCALIFGYRKGMAVDIGAELNLADDKYKEDFTAILPNCSCLTCRKHTKAYINHLIGTKELLAPLLLAMHNTHHYIEFFKAIRMAISQDSLQELKVLVEDQYKNS